GEVQLRRGAGQQADGCAIEFARALDAQRLRHHEALAIEEEDSREREPKGRIARGRPGGVVRQDVDLAGLEGREAVLGVGRAELDLSRIAEYRRRERAAEVGVDATPAPLAVGSREALQADVDRTAQAAARLDGVERRAGVLAPRDGEGQHKSGEQRANHGHITCRYPDRSRFSRFRTESTSPAPRSTARYRRRYARAIGWVRSGAAADLAKQRACHHCCMPGT